MELLSLDPAVDFGFVSGLASAPETAAAPSSLGDDASPVLSPRLVPSCNRRASLSSRRIEALSSLLKPALSHVAIWVSYSDRNLARRSWPQTSGDLTPMVPLAVMIRSSSSI